MTVNQPAELLSQQDQNQNQNQNQDILITYNLSSSSIESLKSIDNSEYWKLKLIQLLIIKPIYNFPNDENSTNVINEINLNDKIYIYGNDLKPGQRGIKSCKYSLAGSIIMKINNTNAVYYFYDNVEEIERTKNPEFINKFEDSLQPYLNINIKNNLMDIEKEVLYLTLRILFCYLYDDEDDDQEFLKKLNNLCTHQKDIRLDNEKRKLINPIKNVIVNTLKEFLIGHDIGANLYKKNSFQITKKNWKFIDDLISIVIINYFTLFNGNKKPLGVCLDPNFALINHSCLPNCTQILNSEENEYQVINTLPIFEDEEITVTYIPLGFPKEIRNFQLFQQFYFHCHCKLCKIDDNNDPFFYIQCNKCGIRIKSPSFKLILTSPNLAMRQHICTKCLNNLNSLIYPKNIKIRNFFMALILFCKNSTGFSFNDQDYFKFLNKEFVKYIENFTLIELIKMLTNGIYQFEIPELRILLIKNVIEIIINDKVFPLFTFPFNLIIRELDNIEENDCKIITSLKDGISKLQLKIQRIFGVDIPSDLTSMLIFDNYLFLDLADLLYQIIKFIINPNFHNKSHELSTLFDDNLSNRTLGVFCQCCFFFYKQVKAANEIDLIEDKLVEIIKIYELSLNDNENLNLNIKYCLEQLFDFGGLYIKVTESQMAIQSAIGYLTYFTIDNDDCL